MVVYFAVVYRLSARRQLQKLVGGLIAAVIASVLLGSLFFSQHAGGNLAGAFGNAQLFASFLAVSLPLVLVASQGDDHPWRRTAGQFALVLAVGALLLTANRSSWLGTLVGLGLLGVLALRRSAGSRALLRQKHQILVPGLVTLAAVGLFFVFSGSLGSVLARGKTLLGVSNDVSFGWRQDMWVAGLKMWLKHPLTGWGIGSFVVFAPFLGAPAIPILEGGLPSLSQMAHNQYVQLLAETGLIGLTLYLAILIGFFARCWRALKENTSHTRQWLLIGSMAAIAAQAVDAFGNPSWQFSEVGLFFWLVLGIGVAASRPRAEREAEEALEAVETQRAPVVRRPSWGTRAGWVMAQAAVVGMGVLLLGQAYAATTGNAKAQPVTAQQDYQTCVITNLTTTPASLSTPTSGINCVTVVATVDVTDPGTGITTTMTTSDVTVSIIDNTSCATITANGNQICASPTPGCTTGGTITYQATFQPTGVGSTPCTGTGSLPETGVSGGGGGQGGGGGGGTAGIIIGAIAGVGLLALLLLRKHHGGGGGEGGEEGGGEEKGGENKGGGDGSGTGTPISDKVKLPPGDVTAVRTEPHQLVVRNREPQELKVFVQLDGKPHWYEVTDDPGVQMKFQGGSARLVAMRADADQYLVERDRMSKEGMKVMVSFRGKTCATPVSFYAP